MFAMDQNKTQEERILTPEDGARGDRESRYQARESRAAWAEPDAEMAHSGYQRSTAHLAGTVEVLDRRVRGESEEWNWQEFQQLERVKVFADFHCVTRWSRLGNTWEGVSTRKLMDLAGGALPAAEYVLARGHDPGFSYQSSAGRFFGRGRAGRVSARWPTPHRRAWMAGAADRPAAVRLEEREVGRWPGAAGSRQSWILGAERVPHAWRPVEGRTFWLVMF